MDKTGKKRKLDIFSVMLILIFLIGAALLLYPTVSDRWNSLHQTRAIASYVDAVDCLSQEQYEEMWQAAEKYNAELYMKQNRFRMSEAEREAYHAILNLTGDGIMGYIEIPRIGEKLPIYHGTSDAVLQVAVGHLEGSSLPVGGEGTHCVLSGHRGLPSAKLFTDLDQMQEGDIFTLCVLDQVLTYETDQILVVEPENMEPLLLDTGRDDCTLVTCTPYGINSHRLLVRGHRIENAEEAEVVRVMADAVQIDPRLTIPAAAVPVLAVFLLGMLIQKKIRRKRVHGKEGEKNAG